MADIDGRQPVKTLTNGDVVIKIVDTAGTNVAGVDASNQLKVIAGSNSGVDIGDVTVNNASGASAVNIQDGGNSITVDQATGTNLHVVVDSGTITASPASVQVDDAAFTPAASSVDMMGATFDDAAPDSIDEGDGGAVRMSANRNLYTRIRDNAGNERGVNVTAASELNVIATAQPGVDVGDVTVNNAAGAAAVNIQDGGNSITVDGTVTATAAGTQDTNLIQIAGASVLAGNGATGTGSQRVTVASDNTPFTVKVSKDASANSETNPIYVQQVTGTVSGVEVINYDTSAAVSAAATDNHDYVVTSAKTFLWRQFLASASGVMKVVLQSVSSIGPTTTTYGTFFTSASNPSLAVTFGTPIEIADEPAADTNTVRIARTNRETAAMDVYSTIVGSEITS